MIKKPNIYLDDSRFVFVQMSILDPILKGPETELGGKFYMK